LSSTGVENDAFFWDETSCPLDELTSNTYSV